MYEASLWATPAFTNAQNIGILAGVEWQVAIRCVSPNCTMFYDAVIMVTRIPSIDLLATECCEAFLVALVLARKIKYNVYLHT